MGRPKKPRVLTWEQTDLMNDAKKCWDLERGMYDLFQRACHAIWRLKNETSVLYRCPRDVNGALTAETESRLNFIDDELTMQVQIAFEMHSRMVSLRRKRLADLAKIGIDTPESCSRFVEQYEESKKNGTAAAKGKTE